MKLVAVMRVKVVYEGQCSTLQFFVVKEAGPCKTYLQCQIKIVTSLTMCAIKLKPRT